ncbi:hypothetical protein IFM89_004909 [Coptis chinensis]|uniref:Mon2/Sec7/BIG1-like HUS domain-containing protein n=1 Tax=Coptis chinensis TaxID=261450 RepID=A0A835I123_9MAGN|nr:hypothetical protein IFM89_004909 [Coptis chinensis]
MHVLNIKSFWNLLQYVQQRMGTPSQNNLNLSEVGLAGLYMERTNYGLHLLGESSNAPKETRGKAKGMSDTPNTKKKVWLTLDHLEQPCHPLAEERINEDMSANSGSPMTITDDAADKGMQTRIVVGKDSKGQCRAMGPRVNKTSMKSMEPILDQNYHLAEENSKLWKETQTNQMNFAMQLEEIRSTILRLAKKLTYLVVGLLTLWQLDVLKKLTPPTSSMKDTTQEDYHWPKKSFDALGLHQPSQGRGRAAIFLAPRMKVELPQATRRVVQEEEERLRVDNERSRHRTIITSDVRRQILVMNRKAKEDWEKKTEETEKIRKVNEPFESMLKECSPKKYADLQKAIHTYLGIILGDALSINRDKDTTIAYVEELEIWAGGADIKMGMKEENDEVTTKTRLLSLELLQRLLEGVSHSFTKNFHFIDSVKAYLSYALLHSSVSQSSVIFQIFHNMQLESSIAASLALGKALKASAVNESIELKHEVEALRGQLATANTYAERCKTSTLQAKEAYLTIRAEVEELKRKMDGLQEERERRTLGEARRESPKLPLLFLQSCHPPSLV